MSNAELIETLKAYPPEAPVTVLWEDFAESEIQAVTFEDGDVLILHDCQGFAEKGDRDA